MRNIIIWIGTRQQLSIVEEEALMVYGQSVMPIKVRDLGVFVDRELADNGGSREQYCTWLHVSTPPTSQRQAVADPRHRALSCHNIFC